MLPGLLDLGQLHLLVLILGYDWPSSSAEHCGNEAFAL